MGSNTESSLMKLFRSQLAISSTNGDGIAEKHPGGKEHTLAVMEEAGKAFNFFRGTLRIQTTSLFMYN